MFSLAEQYSPVETLDDVLKTAIECNSITPLVKHELAMKVKQKRQMSGEGEIKNLFEPPKNYELTTEEKTKMENRKQRNRESAEKARVKRKRRVEVLEDECKMLEDQQRSLNSDIKKLKLCAKVFNQVLHSHAVGGRCTSIPANHPRLQQAQLTRGSPLMNT
ncbi:uncharacterized protein LOC127707686 [Mytilus californianus]|uniref:uncharacterized protein LOC127707686 n=1 Tax=Mytilus californianus TaxID=6549 RepID=UPI00224645F0|nr:uncharacterized protein LOC127707686 [Mytilus californianus]XP_052068309.1 uncharacterized protein LOC127707686 [Mytilus californianus]